MSDPSDRTSDALADRLLLTDRRPVTQTVAEVTPFDRLTTALETLVASAPGTTFVGAHVGCYAENLAWADRMLTGHPTHHVDTGGRFAELGRTPRAVRRLVERHPTRVLFGTDAFPPDASA